MPESLRLPSPKKAPNVSGVVSPPGAFDSAASKYRIAAYEVDPADGSLDWLGSVETAGQTFGMVLDPQERFLYATTIDSSMPPVRSICKYQIQANGSLTGYKSLNISYNPRGLAVSRDGWNLYVPNIDDNKVMAYRINQSNGELTANGYAEVTDQPWLALASPVADRIYVGVSTGTGGQVAAFNIINSATAGTLSALAGSPFNGANYTPHLRAIHPNGSYILASASEKTSPYGNVLEEFAIAADGSVSSVCSISIDGKPVSGAVFHPSGKAVFLASTYAGEGTTLYSYRFDDTDGTMSPIGSVDAGSALWSVAAVVFNQ